MHLESFVLKVKSCGEVQKDYEILHSCSLLTTILSPTHSQLSKQPKSHTPLFLPLLEENEKTLNIFLAWLSRRSSLLIRQQTK